ncbi:DUF350 domain-containing protein [Thalassotalea agarivorans]|uniref:DUF350 domain-containing protein n=1 Tax=Thalassotalea agarivorans TaxID=349064 RepID=A0A1I0FYP5_THASX|nr:DUF350 domain-containing protein [Thalassotalea agarivorans]SET63438.1 protein of unknown function [Thalassotalea agarivorans]
MEVSTLEHSISLMLVNLSYAVLSLFIGVIALVIIDKFIFKDVDFMQEIKKGNLAVAIFQSVILLFIGIVVSSAMA